MEHVHMHVYRRRCAVDTLSMCMGCYVMYDGRLCDADVRSRMRMWMWIRCMSLYQLPHQGCHHRCGCPCTTHQLHTIPAGRYAHLCCALPHVHVCFMPVSLLAICAWASHRREAHVLVCCSCTCVLVMYPWMRAICAACVRVCMSACHACVMCVCACHLLSYYHLFKRGELEALIAAALEHDAHTHSSTQAGGEQHIATARNSTKLQHGPTAQSQKTATFACTSTSIHPCIISQLPILLVVCVWGGGTDVAVVCLCALCCAMCLCEVVLTVLTLGSVVFILPRCSLSFLSLLSLSLFALFLSVRVSCLCLSLCLCAVSVSVSLSLSR